MTKHSVFTTAVIATSLLLCYVCALPSQVTNQVRNVTTARIDLKQDMNELNVNTLEGHTRTTTLAAVDSTLATDLKHTTTNLNARMPPEFHRPKNDTTESPTTSTTPAATTKPTTIKPSSTTSTSPPPPSTTNGTTVVPTPSSTPSSTTPSKPTLPPVPITTSAPHHDDRKFDAPSFIGGIVLACGLSAIGFVAIKFYKARTEHNYHTL